MELATRNGKVILTGEHDSNVISAAYMYGLIDLCAKHSFNCYITICDYGKQYDYEARFEAEGNAKSLENLLLFAKKKNVFVPNELYNEIDRFSQLFNAFFKIRMEKKEAEQKRIHWQHIKKFGCGKCKSLATIVDQFKCNACGEMLEDKNIPYYDYENHIEYLFHFVPFPSDNCPLKAE